MILSGEVEKRSKTCTGNRASLKIWKSSSANLQNSSDKGLVGLPTISLCSLFVFFSEHRNCVKFIGPNLYLGLFTLS